MARSLSLDDLIEFFGKVSRNSNVTEEIQFQAGHWYRALALDFSHHRIRSKALEAWNVDPDDDTFGPNLPELVESRIRIAWQEEPQIPEPTQQNFSRILRLLADVCHEFAIHNLASEFGRPLHSIACNSCNRSTMQKKHTHFFRYVSLHVLETMIFKGLNKVPKPRPGDRRKFYTRSQIDSLNRLLPKAMLLARPEMDFAGRRFSSPVFLCFTDDAPHLKMPRKRMSANYIAEQLGLPDWLKWGNDVKQLSDKQKHGIAVLRVRSDRSDEFFRPTKLLDSPGHPAFTPGRPDNVPLKNRFRHGLTRVCAHKGLQWERPQVTNQRGVPEVVM
ncbi:MAG: hypothetical protein HOL01_07140, partial [Planctomycetaceae bacterium]|nr:hypothetical protein [Planctomycetaceae bacterium]